jgi:hypothetical protein
MASTRKKRATNGKPMTRAVAQLALAEAILREAIADYVNALRQSGASSQKVVAHVRDEVSRMASELPPGTRHDLPERVVDWCIEEFERGS